MGTQAEKHRPRDPVTGVIQGAEPFAFGEGSHAFLFLHGWSSSPRELRFLAQRASAEGFRCEGPLLAGHGTRLEDLMPTRFDHYLAQSLRAFDALSAAHGRVSICGLSMGGLLGLRVATLRPVANLVLIAPFLSPTGSTFGLPNRWLAGRVPLPALMPKSSGGPIEDPEAAKDHIAYHAMPTGSMVSVVRAARRFGPDMPKVSCPALILHAVHDATSDFAWSKSLIEKLGSRDKTLVAFNRGNHILTLDYMRDAVEATALDWMRKRR